MNSITSDTIFLLGAGFSKALDPGMPLVRELPKLSEFEEGSAAQKFCNQTFYDDYEAWLSSLASTCPWQSSPEDRRERKEAFREVLKALQIALITPTLRVREGLLHLAMDTDPYHWIFTLLKEWHRNRCNVITLNYDTILESVAPYYLFPGKAFDEYGFYPHQSGTTSGTPSSLLDCQSEMSESFKLLKLHGSINLWSKEPLRGSDLRKIATTDEAGIREFIKKGYFPYIVPPLSVKDSFYEQQELSRIWSKALKALEDADRLVVMGYSFPVSDWIMKVFLRNLNPQAIVEIVDIGSQALLSAKAIFSEQDRRIYAVISENAIGDYVSQNFEANLEQWVNHRK